MSEFLKMILIVPILRGFNLSETEHGGNFSLVQMYQCLRVLDYCMFY